MSSELRNKIEKQASRIELLEEELRSTNQALEKQTEFAAGLEQDLENAIYQLQRASSPQQAHGH